MNFFTSVTRRRSMNNWYLEKFLKGPLNGLRLGEKWLYRKSFNSDTKLAQNHNTKAVLNSVAKIP